MPGILHWFIHAQSFEFWYLAVRRNDLEKCGFSVAFGAFYRCLHLAFPCKGGRDAPCPRSGPYSSSPGSSRLFPPPLGVEWCVSTLIVSMEWSVWWPALRLHCVAVVCSEFIFIRVRHYYSYRFWSRLGHLCRMTCHAYQTWFWSKYFVKVKFFPNPILIDSFSFLILNCDYSCHLESFLISFERI